MEEDWMQEACSKHRSDEEIKHLVRSSETKRPLGKLKCRYVESNEVNLKGIQRSSVDPIHLLRIWSSSRLV
jgi:hypothetical protein